jgi:medium-chain acyl-[acyl-carrier-protein] hydrolase
VQLPGREGRLKEQPFHNLADAVNALVRDLELGRNELPMAFFGHSLGARLAFELTRELRRRDLRLPVHLILSGCRAGHLPGRSRVSALPDSALVQELRRMGATASALDDSELMALLLPTIRADYTMSETAVFASEPPLSVPITALGGTEDEHVFREDLDAWSVHTTGPFSCHMFPGGHLFINTARDAVVERVIDSVSQSSLTVVQLARMIGMTT